VPSVIRAHIALSTTKDRTGGGPELKHFGTRYRDRARPIQSNCPRGQASQDRSRPEKRSFSSVTCVIGASEDGWSDIIERYPGQIG